MDNFIFDEETNSLYNGLIEAVDNTRNSTLITVSYSNNPNRGRTQTIRLSVNRDTIILNEADRRIPISNLRVGMTINAIFSSAMTRSVPPQANALFIRVLRSQPQNSVTIGRIVNIDRQNMNFTTISDNNLSSTIRFNVSSNTRFFDVFGRPISFRNLVPGLRVRVEHANFMTASIPPQTNAFEVRVIR